jgi:hypothetical protein
MRSFRGFSVDQYKFAVDQFFDAGAAKLWIPGSHGVIEAVSDLVGQNLEGKNEILVGLWKRLGFDFFFSAHAGPWNYGRVRCDTSII